MSELKPCPFCGGSANGVKIMKFGAVMCDPCGFILDRNNPEKAIEAWNRRADLPPTPAQIMADPRVTSLVGAAYQAIEAFNIRQPSRSQDAKSALMHVLAQLKEQKT